MGAFFQGAARYVLVLIEPIGLLWLALIALTIQLWRKRQRRFATASFALVIGVYLVGATGLPGRLLGSLEAPYAGVKLDALPAADAVVMLGGGLTPSRYEVGGLHLTKAGDRLIMALELIRLGKAPVLICGGAGVDLDGAERVEADLLKAALIERQFPVPEIISLGRCTDTHSEAERSLALATERGWRRVLLVTSANHLPRATATFRTIGIDAVPVPCNFLTNVSTAPPPPGFAVPGYDGFEKMSVWLHEKVGWWEYRRRGWIR